MKAFCFFAATTLFLFSCKGKEQSGVERILINDQQLDSVKVSSDTGYTRHIGAAEFSDAEQYIDRRNDITTKIMKDTAGKVVGFVQYRSGKRIDFAEFYSNGQLKAKLPLDSAGQFHGESKLYYEDGRIKSTGSYNHGLYVGEWKNYSPSGALESVDKYDASGQHIGNTKAE